MVDDLNSWLGCPITKSEYPYIVMAHGGGGRLMHQLIDKIFKQAFADVSIAGDHDSAVLESMNGKPAFTTDSYVINPLFFPGGDIGMLAVYGTINDLAMSGAKPLYLSVGFILEEGLPIEDLWRIAISISRAAKEADVKIVTGDTKVVDKGKGDGVFINTAGIGVVPNDLEISARMIKPGDRIILSGDIGRHGIAIMANREGIELETKIESDCAPLYSPIEKLLDTGIEIHCLRDLTRGGLASSLVELSQSSKLRFQIDETLIPVREDVKAVCEILGFDPLYIANEGRFIAFVPENDYARALDILRNEDVSRDACLIGDVLSQNDSIVTMKTILGVERIIDMLSGEQLPRIC